MKMTLLVGRILYSMIFLMSGVMHVVKFSDTVGFAASKGVPMPGIGTFVATLLMLVGGLSVLLGYKAKIGAVLLVVFLVPTSFMMHNFWTISDPMMMQMEMAAFMKNMSMAGGALIIAYFGSGPLSLDKGK